MSFDDFWALYPRKEAKGAARKSHEKALKTVSHETIVTGLTRYLDRIESKQVERKFVKMPATWLNQECWDDEYMVPIRDRIIVPDTDDRRVHLLSVLQDLQRKAIQFNVSYDEPIREITEKLEALG